MNREGRRNMLTNKEILNIAMEQSAIDCNCNAEDFLKKDNVIVESNDNEKKRKYLKLPFSCDLVSYGNNIVASIDKKHEGMVKEYISKYNFYNCFETPNIHVLNGKLKEQNEAICFMAEYFLPDVS